MNKVILLGIIAIILMGSLVFVYDNFLKDKDFIWEGEDDVNLQQANQYNSLSYNGNPLVDHTIFTQEEIQQSNAILGGNYGMYAMISPAYAQDIDGQNIEVDMEFSYIPFLQEGALSHLNAPNNNPRNVSIVLVFEGDLIKGDALLKKNVSYEYKYGSSENAWINNREVLYDSYVDLGTPDDSCVYGNDNNTRMFAVTYQGNTTNYCFTSFTPNGQGNVLLSGNYNKPIDVIETRWEEKYVNVRNRFESLGKNLLGNGFSYYRAENVYFEENDTHELKLIFTPKDREKNGKWHIVMYETEYGLINSITDDRYVYIDPWWDSDWTYKQNVTNLTGNIISLKIDYNANMKSDFSDLRFLTPDETSEYPYALIQVNATTATYKVQTNGSTSLMMYYGNALASYTGNIQGVYPPNLTYAFFFDDGYNESVTGVNGFAVVSGYTTPLQNESFVTYNQNGSSGTGGIFGLTPSSPAEYTYVANAYPTSYSQGTISGFKDASYANKHFVFRNDGGVQGIQQIVGAGPSTNTFARIAAPLNTWHYVVGQAKAGTGNRVYLNGNTSVNTAALGAIGTSASNLDVGTARNAANATFESFAGQIDYWLYFTRFLDVNEVGYLYEQTAPYAVYGAEESQAVDASPTVSLINPADHHDETVNSLIYFGANISDDQLVDNYTLYVWNLDGSLNTSQFYDINQAHNIVNNTLVLQNGSYTWNYYAYDNASKLGMGTNRSLNVSVTEVPLSVSVTLNSPADNNYSNYNLNRLYATLTRLASNSTNGTFYLWNASNQLINYTSIINGSGFIAKSVSPVNNKDLDSVTNLQAGALIYVKNDIYISLLGMNGANLRAFNITDYDGNQIYYSSNLTDGNNNVTFNNVLLLGNNYYRLEFQSLVSTNFVNSNTTAYTNFPIDKDDFIILNNSNGGANTTNTIYYAPAVINYTLKDIDYYDTSFYISNDGVYHWNTYACAENATASVCAYAPANYTLTVDTIKPSLNIIYPTTSIDNESIVGRNITLNYTITDANLQACGYQYNGNNYSVNCNLNSSFTYAEGADSIILWANDSAGNYNSTTRSFTFNDSAPEITIIHPTTLQGEGIAGQNMSLNYTITDPNIESCWYEYNNANYTIDCALNSSFTYVSGVNSIKVWANDTANNINSSTRAFTFTYVTNEVGYTSPIYETSYDNFTYNLTYNASYYSLITAKLFYDGDSYQATQVGTGNPAYFTKSIDVPVVNGVDNKSFYWQITLINSSNTVQFVSQTYNQTIVDINMSFCTTGNITANFTVYDEADLSVINPHNFSATFNYWLGTGTTFENVSTSQSNINSTKMCIFDTSKTYYADAIIEYAQDSYNKRNYYFDSHAFNSQTQEFYLYLLKSTDATSFIIEVKDQTLEPITNALVYIQRYYPGTDEYKTVQIARTDDNGETIGFYKTETVDYRHIIIKDGETLLTTNKQKVVPKSTPYTLTFIVGSSDAIPWEDLEENESITTTLVFNKTSNITTYTYLDETETISYGKLIIVQENKGNKTIVQICNINSTDTSATLECDVSGYTGDFIAYGYIEDDIVKVIQFSITTARDIFGNEGVFIALFIFMVAGFAFIWNPNAGIIGLNAAMIFTNLIGLISVSPVFIFGGIAVSIIAMILLKS